MISAKIADKTRKFFDGTLTKHGAVPRGVDFNSIESQEKRFEQLTQIFEKRSGRVSVNDVGCGYGALYDYLNKKNLGFDFSYTGFDLSSQMIDAAKKHHKGEKNFRAIKIKNNSEFKEADYAFASGIFNKKMEFSNSSWTRFVLDTLQWMNTTSRRGFAFNALTLYSDKSHMRKDLYYADPSFFFDHCKRKFSRHVSLLHDYGLYDFTILVRKHPR